jgi:hypothetical protein
MFKLQNSMNKTRLFPVHIRRGVICIINYSLVICRQNLYSFAIALFKFTSTYIASTIQIYSNMGIFVGHLFMVPKLLCSVKKSASYFDVITSCSVEYTCSKPLHHLPKVDDVWLATFLGILHKVRVSLKKQKYLKQ